MNILETIIAEKRREVAELKRDYPLVLLEKMAGFSRTSLSMVQYLADPSKTGIIAEFKRKSPSKGWIHEGADPEVITAAYTAHGASGLSILTDEKFFGGSLQDLQKARRHPVPILRKEFIIDDYQIVEAKAYGADVVLLIAANLSILQVKSLAATAKNYGLEVLLEIHDEDELEHICDDVDIVGVNNRNLKTFQVDIQTSIRLSKLIPEGKVKISESGISEVASIYQLKDAGFSGFLVGENFMKAAEPGLAFAAFTKQLKEQRV